MAPHQKKVSITRNGMIDQVISRRNEPWMGSGTSVAERRRYFTAKTKIVAKMSTDITTLTSVM